ncbi:EKC/KEOPS complex, subunit Gon7 [Metarhizium album ARSEF 1941]|uniref:EKC/KEOPS complex subunit GON7 n=1 Tax=Metarhizium album (strain ARSEF 1941) TaxID=1081103 RepID=A0A0B2WW32_METAS|nr:EKC/KEOPS complex, subunit Gon7 [Metarhizium album ARSEF 1941]KHN97799.1 EKC/KEOPS complex, subunit Gon7 [Metarhizium album ARSEF 1941]
MAPDTKDTTTLTASYRSPQNEHFTIVQTLPVPASASVQDKTQYLEALRKAVTDTQDQINKELTKRMEQDKAREAASGDAVAARLGTDEDKEEENYGEEVQDEEG